MDENSLFGFNLQSPDYQAGWSYFYFVRGHFCFVCEMSVYVFFAQFSIKFYVLFCWFFSSFLIDILY